MDGKELHGLMEAYSEVYAPRQIDEAVRGADPEMRRAASAERRSGEKRLPPSKGKGYADQQKQSIKWHDKVTKGKFIHGMTTNEELDLFDVVLEFLQTEGFAETLEEAEWLMANVIDEEAIDIILGESQLDELNTSTLRSAGSKRQERIDSDIESGKHDSAKSGMDKLDRTKRRLADKRRPTVGGKPDWRIRVVGESQEARNNPEKYEREQSKKYAPVRGERTPMPPRGDKRREDFEKWYRANVR